MVPFYLKIQLDNPLFLFLGPKSCTDISNSYDQKTGFFEVYSNGNSFLIQCDDAAGNFSVLTNGLAIVAYGPLTATPYELPVKYYTDSSIHSPLIASADSCYQQITFKCNYTSSIIKIYGKSGVEMPQISDSCNPSINLVKTYNGKDLLPISKVSVEGITDIREFVTIDIGNVVCRECE